MPTQTRYTTDGAEPRNSASLRTVAKAGLRSFALVFTSPTRAFDAMDQRVAFAVLMLVVLLQWSAVLAVVTFPPTFLREGVERQIIRQGDQINQSAMRVALSQRGIRFASARTRAVISEIALLSVLCIALVVLLKSDGAGAGRWLVSGALLAVVVALTSLPSLGPATPWIDAGVMVIACSSLLWFLHRRKYPAAPVLWAVVLTAAIPCVGFILRQAATIIFDRDPGHFTLAYLPSTELSQPWLQRLDVFGIWWAFAAAGGLASIAGRPYKWVASILVTLAATAMLLGVHH